MKFCTSCGAGLLPDARFCGKCGTGVVTAATPQISEPAPPPIVPPTAPPPAAPPAPEPVTPAYTPTPIAAAPVFVNTEPGYMVDTAEPSEHSKKWLIGGTLGALALLGGLYYWIFIRDDLSGDGGTPTVQATPKAAEVTKQLYTVTQANVRDRATATGTIITGKLPRGTAVSGKLALGEDGLTDWLQLADGTGFVSAVNLSETEPPKLTKVIADKIWAADRPLEIWAQPDAASSLIDRVAVGTNITVAGLTENDYIEVKLRKGGVGYIADGARIVSLLDAKPIAISFNPNSCNFGGEAEIMFNQLRKKSEAEVDAIEKREFPSVAAHDAALAKLEGRSDFLKLQRSYKGLTVTGIGQHYESQSVYFADPAAKVIEVFKGLGFKMDKTGSFVTQELYAGISATDKTGAAYGKSELNCGV
jgi:hypothetical protein